MKQTQLHILARSWSKPVLMLTATLLMAQVSFAQEAMPVEVAEANLAAMNPEHWSFNCQHDDPTPPPTDPSIIAPLPPSPPADPKKVSDEDMRGGTAQYSITHVADFPVTGGDGNVNEFFALGKTYSMQTGEKTTQFVAIGTLGVCKNVDVSLTVGGTKVQGPQGTHVGGGDSNVTVKWQFYNNPDHPHYTVSSAAEVSLTGDTKRAQDDGYGDPTSVAVSLQHGIMWDDVGVRIGHFEIAQPSVNIGEVYTQSSKPRLENNNIAVGIAGATNFKMDNIRGTVIYERYQSKDVGPFSDHARQKGSTFALSFNKGTSCWVPTVARNQTSQPGSKTILVGFSRTLDRTGACAN